MISYTIRIQRYIYWIEFCVTCVKKSLEGRRPKTRPYTRAEVACGWAGAVMIKSYPSIWAGAVMQKPPVTPKKLSVTDRQTDRPTDRVGHRVACTRLKSSFKALQTLSYPPT